MISLRLDDRQERHLERSTDNKSEYVRGLIDEDIRRSSPNRPFEEYQECQKNITYFVQLYGHYQDQKTGAKPSKTLSDFQKGVLKDLADGKNVIIKKGRRKRVTTTIAHFILWKLLFDPGSTIYSNSSNIESQKRLNHELPIDIGYKNLPEDFRVGLMRETPPKLSNGSHIVTSRDEYQCDVAIFEEAGYWELPIRAYSDTQKIITYTAVEKRVFDMSSGETKNKKPDNIQNEEMLEELFIDSEFEPYDLT